jgi:hypothetical protein
MYIRNMYQHEWCLISHVLGKEYAFQVRLTVSNEGEIEKCLNRLE